MNENSRPNKNCFSRIFLLLVPQQNPLRLDFSFKAAADQKNKKKQRLDEQRAKTMIEAPELGRRRRLFSASWRARAAWCPAAMAVAAGASCLRTVAHPPRARALF